MLKRVTTSDARKLERAMMLLNKGKISYGRWVETLDGWLREEDIESWDYGDAESQTQRMARAFSGRTMRTAEIARELGKPAASYAGPLLVRLARRGLVIRVKRGVWRFA